MFFKKKHGTIYKLVDNLIEITQRTTDIKLKWKILSTLLEIRWTKNYYQEIDKINQALISKGEKIRVAWGQYKEDLLVAEREGKDTVLIKSKLEVLEKLMEGI